ncbi:hypothetical protein ACP70R_046869 [Stipagrostis hirtigluma subsp. patula]
MMPPMASPPSPSSLPPSFPWRRPGPRRGGSRLHSNSRRWLDRRLRGAAGGGAAGGGGGCIDGGAGRTTTGYVFLLLQMAAQLGQPVRLQNTQTPPPPDVPPSRQLSRRRRPPLPPECRAARTGTDLVEWRSIPSFVVELEHLSQDGRHGAQELSNNQREWTDIEFHAPNLTAFEYRGICTYYDNLEYLLTGVPSMLPHVQTLCLDLHNHLSSDSVEASNYGNNLLA